jgi:hypothetical protein
MEIYTHVPADLHPDVIKGIEGYDDEIHPHVAPAITALSTVYEGLHAIHTAREAADKNPTWNEASKVIQTADFADKVVQRAAKQVDSIVGSMRKTVDALEAELSAPLDQAAGSRPINSEIRAFVKGLKADERMKWFSNALRNGDTLSLVAVLGAPSYLSGMTDEMKAAHVRHYHETMNPQTAKRLRMVKAALDIVMDRTPLMFTHSEKLIGADRRKVAALRKAKTDAEAAFILRTDSATV